MGLSVHVRSRENKMKPIVQITGAIAVLLGMLMPLQAGAKTLYGSANGGLDFITVESTTGVATLVATFNPAGQYFALEFTPDGTLWAIEMGTGQLYTVDPATGALTAVGTPIVNALFTQLASDSDGNLYATDNTIGSLYSIHKVTGRATAIGSTGLGVNVGVSFNTAGALYGADGAALTLNTVEPATGATTFVAPITGFAANWVGLAIDQAAGTAYMMDFTPTGSLYTLDLATGEATLVGATGMDFSLDLAIRWPVAAVAAGDDGCGWLMPAGKQSLWVLAILPLMIAGIVLVRRRT